MPIHGKNIWRLCKTYGRLIGVPELKLHDLRHGVAMEVLEQQHDLEAGARPAGPSPARHDPDLRQHPSGAAQARGRVLRGQSCAPVERIKPPLQSCSGTSRCDSAKGSIRGIGRRKGDSNTHERTKTALDISVFEDTPVMSSNVEP